MVVEGKTKGKTATKPCSFREKKNSQHMSKRAYLNEKVNYFVLMSCENKYSSEDGETLQAN